MEKSSAKANLCCVCLVLILLLAACDGKPTEPAPVPTAVRQVKLTISGSGTASTILEGIKSAFEADVPGYTLDILPGTGTGEGVKGAVQGIFDVAAMARSPKDEEAAEGIEYTEFGLSGVAVFAHLGVGVANLTTAQVQALFSGEIANWSAVGGPDLPVVLYVRDEGDSSTQSLRKVFFGDTAFPESAQVLTSQTDMQAAVAGTPGGVGFGSWPAVLATQANVKSITLDGVGPGDSSYPMFSPVGIGYLSTRKADVQPFADWLTSEQGKKALAEFDVILTSP